MSRKYQAPFKIDTFDIHSKGLFAEMDGWHFDSRDFRGNIKQTVQSMIDYAYCEGVRKTYNKLKEKK